MRILMFNYEYPPLGGGGGVASLEIAEELAKRHRVVMVTSRTAALPLPAVEERGGVEIHRVRVANRNSQSVASYASLVSYPPAAWRKAVGLLRKERFDVVNAHFAVPTGPASLPVARIGRIPHVLSIHGGDIFDPTKRFSPHKWGPLRTAVRSCLWASDEVVAQSDNTRDNARQYFGYRGSIRVIPLGIRAPADTPPATRAELGLPEDRFVLVTVGRLVKRKAVDRLIRVMGRLDDVPVHLVVAGSGSLFDPLRQMVSDLDLEDRVHFVGWVEDAMKWQLLRASDAFVSTSVHEGFGLMFIEAMAMGLPIVAPAHGGQMSFLRHGQTGFVIPGADEEEMADAIRRMVRSPGLVRRMGETNRELAAWFSAERCAAEYEALFEEIVARR